MTPNTATLREGKFDGSAIRELSLYNDGVIVKSPTSSEHIDAFLEDLFRWFKSDLDYELTEKPKLRKVYQSELVISADSDLDTLLAPLKSIASKLTKIVSKETQFNHPYKSVGFLCAFDPAFDTAATPGVFRLERKLNQQFEENMYYSMSPTTTRSHIDLLEEIEKMAS